MKNLEKISTIKNEQIQESNDAYVSENSTLLRRQDKEESLLVRNASMPLKSTCTMLAAILKSEVKM